MEQKLVVTQACVGTEDSLLADPGINVSRRLRCAMVNLSVKIGRMWSFVASTAMMFVLLRVMKNTLNVLVLLYHNT